MNTDDSLALIVLFGIIIIVLFGGATGSGHSFFSTSGGALTQSQKQAEIGKEIQKTQQKVDDLKVQVQAAEDAKTHSTYFGTTHILGVNRSTDPSQEYITIQVYNWVKTGPVDVTGWTIKSLNSGESIAIPQASYLYFSNSSNSKNDIYLATGDTLYLITGRSPIGESFKLNKCSGYLNQFHTFVPYISTQCPAPRYENLSSIPKSSNNDACLDYINAFPSCTTQMDNMPSNWSYECTNFISTKINYPSCVDIHKGDKDFYLPTWQVYLNRSVRLWKDYRENIVLYDRNGKIVDTLTY